MWTDSVFETVFNRSAWADWLSSADVALNSTHHDSFGPPYANSYVAICNNSVSECTLDPCFVGVHRIIDGPSALTKKLENGTVVNVHDLGLVSLHEFRIFVIVLDFGHGEC